MPKPAQLNKSELYLFEFHRRADEIRAIINYACILISIENELKRQLDEVKKFNKSKFLWLTFIFSIILNIALRKSGVFSFELEWNFGLFLQTVCMLIFAINHLKERFIANKLEEKIDQFRELAFKFDAITAEGYRLWDIRNFIDEDGYIQTDEDSSSKYNVWLKQIFKNLEYKLSSYTHE